MEKMYLLENQLVIKLNIVKVWFFYSVLMEKNTFFSTILLTFIFIIYYIQFTFNNFIVNFCFFTQLQKPCQMCQYIHKKNIAHYHSVLCSKKILYLNGKRKFVYFNVNSYLSLFLIVNLLYFVSGV